MKAICEQCKKVKEFKDHTATTICSDCEDKAMEEKDKMRFVEMPKELNFNEVIKYLGGVNKAVYGVNPYEVKTPNEETDFMEERKSEITQDQN